MRREDLSRLRLGARSQDELSSRRRGIESAGEVASKSERAQKVKKLLEDYETKNEFEENAR